MDLLVVVVVVVSCLLRFCFSRICLQLSLKDFFFFFIFLFPAASFFVWVGGWCFFLGEGGCFVRSRKWVLESSSDPVSYKDFGGWRRFRIEIL